MLSLLALTHITLFHSHTLTKENLTLVSISRCPLDIDCVLGIKEHTMEIDTESAGECLENLLMCREQSPPKGTQSLSDYIVLLGSLLEYRDRMVCC